MSMKGVYLGEKHCELTHIGSGNTISTDAPKDNHGRGEAFSPTDLTTVSLAACMSTVMAIEAEKQDLSLKGMNYSVIKVMGSDPRRIVGIQIEMNMPPNISVEWQEKLIEIALNCPVKNSLHPDVKIDINWKW